MSDRYDSTYAVSFEFNSPNRLSDAMLDQWIDGLGMQQFEATPHFHDVYLCGGNTMDVVFTHDNPRYDHVPEAATIGQAIAGALHTRVASVEFIRTQVWVGDVEAVDIDVTDDARLSFLGREDLR